MRSTWLILRREFVERVRTRGFLLGTLLLPLLLLAAIFVPAGGSSPPLLRIAVVEEDRTGAAEPIAQILGSSPAGEPPSYWIERVAAPRATSRAMLDGRIRTGELDGYLWLPTGAVESGRVVLTVRQPPTPQAVRDIGSAASAGLQASRLRDAGVDPRALAELLRPAQVEVVTAAGPGGRDPEGAFLFGYLAAFLIYLLIIVHGQNVLRSVLEEKAHRISEVLVSSVPAFQLMVGKVVGVGSVALLQMAIWVSFAAFTTSSRWPGPRWGSSGGLAGLLDVPPRLAAPLLAFFVLGFFLYAAVFAAMGAALSSEQEAQQSNVITLLPLFFPLVFVRQLADDPLGPLATTLGLIPFTAPIAMPIRLGSASLPALQVALSLLLLGAAVGATTWAAGKIYRIGILSTGRRASLREIGRWLRSA